MTKKFNHKLNESEVRMIRMFWGYYPKVTINQMAERFKVNVETIRLVVHGKTWKHLPIHKPHPMRALKIRGYNDTDKKRNKQMETYSNKKKIASGDRDKYPRGSVLAGGNK